MEVSCFVHYLLYIMTVISIYLQTRGREAWGYCLMGMEFLLEMKETFWKWIVVIIAQ